MDPNKKETSSKDNVSDSQDQSFDYGSAERIDGIEQDTEQAQKESKTRLIILFIFLIIVLGIAAAYYFLVYSKEETPKISACNYNGVAYSHGSSFELDDGCNVCTCRNGEMECTDEDCEAEVKTSTTTSSQGAVNTKDWVTYEATISLSTEVTQKTYDMIFKLPSSVKTSLDEENYLLFFTDDYFVMEFEPSLDDANSAYSETKETELIKELNFKTDLGSEVYRISSLESNFSQDASLDTNIEYNYFYYTDYYNEGEDCDEWSPQPAACSFSTVTVFQDNEFAGGLSIKCAANSEIDDSVEYCDNIVKEMSINIT